MGKRLVYTKRLLTGLRCDLGVSVDECELESLAASDVKKLEADCFWCFSKLLDGIQDNYTFAQPGIQKRVNSLKDLVSRIDSKFKMPCYKLECR